MPECSLEYLFSFSFSLKLPPEQIGPVPEGIRANFYLDGGVRRPHTQGESSSRGADYLLIRKDGVGILDDRARIVRLTLRAGTMPRCTLERSRYLQELPHVTFNVYTQTLADAHRAAVAKVGEELFSIVQSVADQPQEGGELSH